MKTLNILLSEASDFIKAEFNLEIMKSKIKLYSLENWQIFCEANRFDSDSEGLYVPLSYLAYVHTESPFLISNIFHELYGHGLFCEYSSIGKQLPKLIKRDTKEYFFGKNKQTLGIFNQNIANYEGFAIWLESLLCTETGNKSIWELKKNHLPKNHVQAGEVFEDFEKNFSRFGLMSQMGFPKYYDNEKILEVIKKLYGNSFNNIESIIIYGSRKPKSDIDLFIVSNNPSQNYFNGWLDIYELNKTEFYYELDNFDISVTDPIFSGKLIYGDNNHLEKIKKNILKKPITKKAISHNLSEAEKQKHYLKNLNKKDKRRKDCLSYIGSFSKNSRLLSQGIKALTLKKLMII
ncbi:MAG: nucleotidyltransferase domain-containing protein [Nanoarchaeota archaeon]|nr:nucleotidyltransferase domain-containing protein [Nanoarchaeota archaeon]